MACDVNQMNSFVIEPATPDDVESIAALLAPNVIKQSVLPRSPSDILDHIGNFRVARAGDRLAGCVALRDFGGGLFEVRSLVVGDDYSGCGLGSALVKNVLSLAVERGGVEVFTLTIRPRLFARLGFEEVPMESFHRDDKYHEKIWSDCRLCPKIDCCDEIALRIRIG